MCLIHLILYLTLIQWQYRKGEHRDTPSILPPLHSFSTATRSSPNTWTFKNGGSRSPTTVFFFFLGHLSILLYHRTWHSFSYKTYRNSHLYLLFFLCSNDEKKNALIHILIILLRTRRIFFPQVLPSLIQSYFYLFHCAQFINPHPPLTPAPIYTAFLHAV